MGSSAVLPRSTEKPVVWGDGDGSPVMLWANAKKDQQKLDSPNIESKKAALEAFYEQMAKSTDDLTLKDLVQPSATSNSSSNDRRTRFDDDVDARMETVLEGESELERSSADQPGKPGLRIGDVLGKENLRPKKKNFTAPTAKSSRSQTSACAAARSPTPPRTSLTKPSAARSPIAQRSQKRRTSGGKAVPRTTFPRTPARTPNHREVAQNFQCKNCFLCGTKPYFFKTRCLVCGKLYCAKCVKKAMGNMLEGPKCVKCLGLRFSETWYSDRLASAKGCISLPLFGKFRADRKDLICHKTAGFPSKEWIIR